MALSLEDRPFAALVPRYDVYVLNGYPRSQLVPKGTERIRSYRMGRYEGPVGVPLVIIDGWVRGMWEWTSANGGLRVEIFDPDPSRTDRVEEAARRVLSLAGRDGPVVYGRLDP